MAYASKQSEERIKALSRETENLLNVVPKRTTIETKQFLDTQTVVMGDLVDRVGKAGKTNAVLFAWVNEHKNEIDRMIMQKA